MQMVKSRNESSHIYHEETAQNIAQKIPAYYDLIKEIVDRIYQKIHNA